VLKPRPERVVLLLCLTVDLPRSDAITSAMLPSQMTSATGLTRRLRGIAEPQQIPVDQLVFDGDPQSVRKAIIEGAKSKIAERLAAAQLITGGGRKERHTAAAVRYVV
jgi:hypothetical protein